MSQGMVIKLVKATSPTFKVEVKARVEIRNSSVRDVAKLLGFKRIFYTVDGGEPEHALVSEDRGRCSTVSSHTVLFLPQFWKTRSCSGSRPSTGDTNSFVAQIFGHAGNAPVPHLDAGIYLDLEGGRCCLDELQHHTPRRQ